MAVTNNLFDLTDRVAVVTGSSRGIGLSLANALASAGATVVINARDERALKEAESQLAGQGFAVHAHVADVTDQEQVTSMIDRVEAEVGPIEILVNSAGIQQRAPFLEFPIDGFEKLLDVNLVAPFRMAQAVGKKMAERGRGKIVNIGSVQSQLGRPTIAPYTATKGGLMLLTRGLCADLAPMGIQVNMLSPGYFATKLTEALVEDVDFSDWLAKRTPAGRWGDVSELGGAVVFLSSDASSFVNGQTLYVDGGMTAVV